MPNPADASHSVSTTLCPPTSVKILIYETHTSHLLIISPFLYLLPHLRQPRCLMQIFHDRFLLRGRKKKKKLFAQFVHPLPSPPAPHTSPPAAVKSLTYPVASDPNSQKCFQDPGRCLYSHHTSLNLVSAAGRKWHSCLHSLSICIPVVLRARRGVSGVGGGLVRDSSSSLAAAEVVFFFF